MTQIVQDNYKTIWEKIPKNPQENAKLRKRILKASPTEQKYWKEYFESGVYGFMGFINSVCWLYEVRAKESKIPWITWECQDNAAIELFKAVDEGHDILIDKSRDMGCSWLNLVVLFYFWLFKPDSQLLIASRKEEFVDKYGAHGCLFWKLDFLLENLPVYMRPEFSRTHMNLRNLDNGSCFVGESTNPNLFRGSRAKACLIDEAAAIEQSRAVRTSITDVSPCILWNSTPQGRGNAFADVRFGGETKIITLHWSDHPEKGKDKYQVLGADGVKRWTSPWYEEEVKRRGSKQAVAQELDCDYLASGGQYFDSEILQALRASGTLMTPKLSGELVFDVKTNREGKSYKLEVDRFVEKPSGLVKIWQKLVNNKLNQDTNYVAFCDISMGTGASNSVITFLDMATREVVLEYATPYEPPHDFARYVVALCLWVGGQSNVFLGWEANGGGGEIFGREIIRLNYGPYYRDRTEDVSYRPEGKKYGWHSTRAKKQLFLGDLRASLAKQELIIHNEEVVSELEQYITFKDGSVGPSAIVEESSGARANHGDRVISIGGLVLLAGEYFKAKPEARKIDPIYSFEGRNKTYKANKKKKKDQW